MADDPADALYAGELEDFVGARDALAKALRADGDRDGAVAVKKLAKPTRAAWAVNRLVRERPEEIRALVAAGEALAGAQEQLLDGADAAVLRGAAEAARRLVDALAAEASVDGAARDKVRATLHAATVDPEVRAEVAAGRVVKERSAAGFGGLEALIAAGRGTTSAPSRPTKGKGRAKAKRAAEPPAPPEPAGPDPREVRRRRDALRRANEAEADAESELDGARRALEQVEATLVARRRDLEQAEAAVSSARDRRERAEAAAAELDEVG
ncbi:hypothetical protein DSM104299_01238 [Baekduia alba]|uniref:hypothetical protein n=1 Tax=Baekduia alba TaxID=2997333 RepID=UPI0023425CF3|nr:hypothetical protein [Baekduia alba]WCB92542.1 hypothetical protein DSM104299_01238 [Baekduia alba]